MSEYKLCRDSQLLKDIWDACKDGEMFELKLIDGNMLRVTPILWAYLPGPDDMDDDVDAIVFKFRFGACVTLRGSDIESYEMVEDQRG